MNQANFVEAEKKFLKAVAIDPGYGLAHYNLGGLYHQQLQRYPAAEEHYRKAIDLNPSNYVPYYNIAIVYTAIGKKQEAIVSDQ